MRALCCLILRTSMIKVRNHSLSIDWELFFTSTSDISRSSWGIGSKSLLLGMVTTRCPCYRENLNVLQFEMFKNWQLFPHLPLLALPVSEDPPQPVIELFCVLQVRPNLSNSRLDCLRTRQNCPSLKENQDQSFETSSMTTRPAFLRNELLRQSKATFSKSSTITVYLPT